MKLKPRSTAIGMMALLHSVLLAGEIGVRAFLASLVLVLLILLAVYDLQKDGLIR